MELVGNSRISLETSKGCILWSRGLEEADAAVTSKRAGLLTSPNGAAGQEGLETARSFPVRPPLLSGSLR